MVCYGKISPLLWVFIIQTTKEGRIYMGAYKYTNIPNEKPSKNTKNRHNRVDDYIVCLVNNSGLSHVP